MDKAMLDEIFKNKYLKLKNYTKKLSKLRGYKRLDDGLGIFHDFYLFCVESPFLFESPDDVLKAVWGKEFERYIKDNYDVSKIQRVDSVDSGLFDVDNVDFEHLTTDEIDYIISSPEDRAQSYRADIRHRMEIALKHKGVHVC